MIRVPQVRVVDEDGSQLGVMPTPQAMTMAQDRGLDLVEVAPTAAPPVVRFLDFGQYKYELTKREKEAKRKQRAVEFKEVRLSPKIGTGDFETKVHRAIEFLEDGDRIKVTVRFRGRELTHPELGRNLLARFGDAVKDHGTVDRTPVLEGKSMFMTLASVHKPRVHEHRSPGPRPEEPEAATDQTATAAVQTEAATDQTATAAVQTEAATDQTATAAVQTEAATDQTATAAVQTEAATDQTEAATDQTATAAVQQPAPPAQAAEASPAGE